MVCRMPAEWEPHAATWLTWPTNKTTWPGSLLRKVERTYLEMIRALLPGERVNLLVNDKKAASKIRACLPRAARAQNLIFHKVKTVDTWIRDYGPIFVCGVRPLWITRSYPQGSDPVLTKWIFNAWGGKYTDLARDNGVVDRIKALKSYERVDPGIVLEGGSIDMNGLGTCLTTEQCLLNSNRNSHLSKKQIEGYLKKYLGVTKTIWLKEGIEGDDTDGHVDDIARFVGPRTILTVAENDKRDKNHAILRENLEILKKETDQDGKRLRVIELPMPGIAIARPPQAVEAISAPRLLRRSPRRPPRNDRVRLPASYANFYIANGVVLVPTYSHKNDRTALNIIQKVFPSRKVIGIECAALVHGLGSIHCVTQQEPGPLVIPSEAEESSRY
ncbi:MAG: agmatine deiminase family protein, partial [Candidatus Omnitrophica bacterium]|nr:agmatine deiminase family protein [Candidatus Omnitrophota bacterium]